MCSLALTAENWEPCAHITQGMVRAKGLEGSEIEKAPSQCTNLEGKYNEVQLARSLQLRLVSRLGLTAENWEPCVHITPGMVRANGKSTS